MPSCRILLVDDDEFCRILFGNHLRGLGHQVQTCADGRSALHLLESGAPGQRPDAVIVDQMMPGMSGLEFTARVRGRGDSTPIALVSANLRPDLHLLAEALGIGVVLPKPLDPDTLADDVARLVQAVS